MRATVSIRIEEAVWVKVLQITEGRVLIEYVVANKLPQTRWLGVDEALVLGVGLEHQQ